MHFHSRLDPLRSRLQAIAMLAGGFFWAVAGCGRIGYALLDVDSPAHDGGRSGAGGEATHTDAGPGAGAAGDSAEVDAGSDRETDATPDAADSVDGRADASDARAVARCEALA